MPGSPIRVALRVARCGQCFVGSSPIGVAGPLVHRRANEWVAEREVRPRFQQPSCVRGHDGLFVEVEPASGTPDRADITGRVGRRDEQESLGWRWKLANLAEEMPLQSPADGQRLRQLHGSPELVW